MLQVSSQPGVIRYDTRVAAPGRTALGLLPARSSHVAFAQAIAQRFARRSGMSAALDTNLLRRAAPTIQHVSQHLTSVLLRQVASPTYVSLTPHLDLVSLSWLTRERPADTASQNNLVATRLVQRDEIHVLQPRVAPVTPLPIEELTHRLVARGERVAPGCEPMGGGRPSEAGGVQGGSACRVDGQPQSDVVVTRPARSDVAAPQANLPGIVVRRSTSRAPAEAQAVLPDTPQRDASELRRPGSPLPTVGSQPIDLGRLTEQVIQTIDRRIIAQRERLGRV